VRDLPQTDIVVTSAIEDQIAKEVLEINSIVRMCINITHTGAPMSVRKMASLPRTDPP